MPGWRCRSKQEGRRLLLQEGQGLRLLRRGLLLQGQCCLRPRGKGLLPLGSAPPHAEGLRAAAGPYSGDGLLLLEGVT